MDFTNIEESENLVALTVTGRVEPHYYHKGHLRPIYDDVDVDKLTIKNLESRDLYTASIATLVAAIAGVADKAELKVYLHGLL